MRQTSKAQETKIDRLEKASTFFWLLSAFITWSFFHAVAQEQEGNAIVLLATSVVLSLAFQYGITLAESALFDGTVPAPWNIDWKAGGPLPWLCVGSITALFVDITLNIGGVWVYVSKLEKTGIGAVGVDSVTIGALKVIATILIAALCATGSELLKEYANYLRTGVAGTVPPMQRQPHITEHREPEIKSRSGASDAEIARLKQQREELQQREKNRRAE